MKVVSYAVNYVGVTAVNAVVGVPLGVLDAARAAVKTTVGVAASALSIATFGKITFINNWASLTSEARNIVRLPYQAVASVINPNFPFKDNEYTTGFVTSRVADPIFQRAMIAAVDDKDLYNSRVVSRGYYALGALVSVATRVADFALGVVAAAFSIVPCLGRVKKVNTFAVKHLMATNVVSDICVGLRGFVNPQQFVKLRTGDVYESN